MFSRSQSAKKTSFNSNYRPPSPNKFLYFGDGSQISQLASLQFKKSGSVLGTPFLQTKSKFSYQSNIENKGKSSLKQCLQYGPTYHTLTRANSRLLKQKNQQKQFKKPLLKSQISDIQSLHCQSIGNIKQQIGYLSGKVKNLQQILQNLTDSNVRNSRVTIRKCASASSKDFPLSPPFEIHSPSIVVNDNFQLDNWFHKTQSSKKFKTKQHFTSSSNKCNCKNSDQKQQMAGIIFELYEQNKFYQKQISKLNDIKKSNVLKNKQRIKQLLLSMRDI